MVWRHVVFGISKLVRYPRPFNAVFIIICFPWLQAIILLTNLTIFQTCNHQLWPGKANGNSGNLPGMHQVDLWVMLLMVLSELHFLVFVFINDKLTR